MIRGVLILLLLLKINSSPEIILFLDILLDEDQGWLNFGLLLPMDLLEPVVGPGPLPANLSALPADLIERDDRTLGAEVVLGLCMVLEFLGAELDCLRLFLATIADSENIIITSDANSNNVDFGFDNFIPRALTNSIYTLIHLTTQNHISMRASSSQYLPHSEFNNSF